MTGAGVSDVVTSAPIPAHGEPRRVAEALRVLSPKNVSGIYVLGLIILVFGLWVPDTFFTVDNLKSLVGQQGITAILALGLLLPLAAGGFDLSVGAILGFCALLFAWLIVRQDVAPVLALALTIVAGGLVGSLNGAMVVGLRVNPLVATLATSSVLAGLTVALSDNQQISPIPDEVRSIGQGEWLGMPIVFWYMLILAVVLWYFLEHSPPGRRLYATGSNREAARLAGVRTGRLTFFSYAVAGAIAAVAGIVLTAKLGSGSPTVGPEYLLPVFAATFLGATQFKNGRVNVWGTILAVAILSTGVRGLELAGAEFWVGDVFNGAALAIAVGVASFQRRS